jgi:hypothetical protein
LERKSVSPLPFTLARRNIGRPPAASALGSSFASRRTNSHAAPPRVGSGGGETGAGSQPGAEKWLPSRRAWSVENQLWLEPSALSTAIRPGEPEITATIFVPSGDQRGVWMPACDAMIPAVPRWYTASASTRPLVVVLNTMRPSADSQGCAAFASSNTSEGLSPGVTR